MLHELPLTVCGAAARRRLGALVTRRPNNGHCRILAAQQHTNDEQQHTRKVATVAREVFDGNFGARLVKSKFAPPVRTSESPRVALVQMQCVHLSGVPFLRYVGLLEQKLREFLGIGGGQILVKSPKHFSSSRGKKILQAETTLFCPARRTLTTRVG